MTTVFIGGSRAFSRVSAEIRSKLDDLMHRGCTILIGDANGADRAVQSHLANRGYTKVFVYCMDVCRNNLGSWPTKQLSKPGSRRDFAYYVIKDRAVASDARCGLMLWDGKSRGTLNNIHNLISMGKKILVYYRPEKTFRKLVTEQDLDELLQRGNRMRIREAQRQIQGGPSQRVQLPLNSTTQL